MKTLADVAYVIRSKNAGPFQLCIDIIFLSSDIYSKMVARDNLLTKDILAKTLGLEEHSLKLIWFPAALALKIVYPRMVPAGDITDTDVYGAQQYPQLLNLPVDV